MSERRRFRRAGSSGTVSVLFPLGTSFRSRNLLARGWSERRASLEASEVLEPAALESGDGLSIVDRLAGHPMRPECVTTVLDLPFSATTLVATVVVARAPSAIVD